MWSRFLDIMNLRDVRGSHMATPADSRDTRNMEVCREHSFEKSGDSLKSCREEWETRVENRMHQAARRIWLKLELTHEVHILFFYFFFSPRRATSRSTM